MTRPFGELASPLAETQRSLVVIARDCRASGERAQELRHAPHDAHRVGAPVDEIAEEEDAIPGSERDAGEEIFQLAQATVDVADEDGARHGVEPLGAL